MANPNPKSELEELMNTLLPFGQQMLENSGELIPFGGAMKPNGEIKSIAGYDGDIKYQSQDIIKLLKDNYRESAKNGEYIATAIFFDVSVTPPGDNKKTDAIAIALDHIEQYSVIVFFPYRIINFKLQFGAVFAQDGKYEIFKELNCA